VFYINIKTMYFVKSPLISWLNGENDWAPSKQSRFSESLHEALFKISHDSQ